MMRSDLAVNDPSGVNQNCPRSPETAVMSVPEKSDGRPLAVEARCVRLHGQGRRPGLARAGDRAAHAVARRQRGADRGQGGGRQSVRCQSRHRPDVLRGISAHARPGLCGDRDRWSRPAWIGREVFGSSGDLGIRRDGSHATHLAVEADAVVEKPASLSWEQAAGLGVPFVTAMEGFRRAGMPKRTETVLVMGVNGKVGQAAVQIATWHGARVVGVVRKNEPYEGHANSKVDVIDASATDVAARVREITGRQGRRHRLQYRRRSLFSGRASIAGAARAPDPDRRHRPGRAVQYPGILSRPAHLCRHRHAGAVVDRRPARC